MDPLTAALLGTAVNAGVSLFTADKAADASSDAARKARAQQREDRNIALSMFEPTRYRGYQAGGDLDSALGYQTAAYAPLEQLTASNANPADANVLSTKAVKKMLKQGMSLEDIGGIGRLKPKVGAKQIRKLGKFGVTPEQITSLQTSPALRDGAQVQTATPGAVPGAAAPAGGAPSTGNAAADKFARFYDSPDYQFRLSEGAKLVQNSAAARGGLFSGQTGKDLTRFGQGVAAGEYDNWFRRRAMLAGYGDQAASQGVGVIGQTGANIAQSHQFQGAGRASAYGQMGQAVGGAIDSGVQNYLFSQYLKRAA